MAAERVVRGQVVLPVATPPLASADVVIKVEDISRADMPSTVIGQSHQENVRLEGGASLPFAIEIPQAQIDEKHLYVVTVHVDLTRTGKIEKGDLITQQTYPVLTRGHGDSVRVQVKSV